MPRNKHVSTTGGLQQTFFGLRHTKAPKSRPLSAYKKARVMNFLRLVFISFAIVWPTLLTLVYFQWLHNSPAWLQQGAYGVGKLIQFSLPIAFVVWITPGRVTGLKFWQKKRKPNFETVQETKKRLLGEESQHDASSASILLSRRSFVYGVWFGLMVVVTIFVCYFALLPDSLLTQLKTAVVEKVTAQGIGTAARFLAVAVFYTFLHSLLEEYYWRWFVYDELASDFPSVTANIISSLGFMAHHVVLVGYFIGWTSVWTYLISGSVAVGGAFWAWLFERPGGFRSCWLSHAIVDAGIFALGFVILFSR